MSNRPLIDAPGLAWYPRKAGWEARWRARGDLVALGFKPKSVGLWTGHDPDEITVAYIQERCNYHQDEMLVFGKGGIPVEKDFDGTIRGLAACYKTDQDSSFHKLRHQSHISYETMFGLMMTTPFPDDDGTPREFGDVAISTLKGRSLLRLYRIWTEQRSIAMAYSKIKMLRIAVRFGATILEDEGCIRLAGILSGMRFKQGKPRDQLLTSAQIIAIRAKAHEQGWPSLALAQAIQFECTLRQKDVIGEWVPVDEPGPPSTVLNGDEKWIRGVCWHEVDENFVLRHITSKRQKLITVDLKNAPMVMEELGNRPRSDFPASGPIVVNEQFQVPWRALYFRQKWRLAATAAGVPKTIKNMDSRAGAITEALEAGALLENVRKTATHSDVSMTQRYSRADDKATAEVMQLRAKSRENKAG